MTLEEIRNEINKDYPILLRKMGYVAHDLKKKLSKEDKAKGFVKFYDYVSKYKNKWIYRVEIKQKKSFYEAMMLYHNGKGHAAISVTNEMNIIYHTGHFFERYNERLNLGLKSLRDIICTYMNESNTIKIQELYEIEPDIYEIFSIIPSGYVLGILNRKLWLVKANTFITNEMLHPNQFDIITELKNNLENIHIHREIDM